MDQKLDELYKLYDELGKAEKEGKLAEKTKSYEEIITRATTGSSQEKRLVSQFIAKFFKHFAELELRAVEAQIELCDDADINVRKQAIHDLPSFCAKGHDDPYISRVAIVLCQLLTVEEKGELAIVEKSLSSLLRLSINATIKGIFAQMTSAICDETIRDACIRFLCGKVNTKTLERDTEEMIFEETTKVAQLSGGEEFVLLVKLLSGLKISKLIANQQTILNLIAEKLELTTTPALPEEHSIKLKACLPLAVPFFSPFAPSLAYVHHIACIFMPTLDFKSAESLDLLKLFAQVSTHTVKPTDEKEPETDEKIIQICETLLTKIGELLPAVPADDDLEKEPELPSLQLSHLECLLVVFHNIARKVKPAIVDDEVALKSIRQRLQYLNRGLQAENKKLRGVLAQGVKVEKEKRATIQLTQKTISNLSTFIKDWFHNPPIFKSLVTPSWLQENTTAVPKSLPDTNPSNGKRRALITFDKDPETSQPPPKRAQVAVQPGRGRPNRQLYQAPRGNSARGRFKSSARSW